MPDNATDLLASMVRINSVGFTNSGRLQAERELAEHMERTAAELGFKTQRLPVADRGFNLLVTCSAAGAEAPWLLFESHLDTVGVERMTIDPFDPVIRDGCIHGRGACDTKGSGAAMLWALTRYRKTGPQPNNIAILYSLDEEAGKAGVTAFANEQLPTLGWRPSAAIVGEPTMLRAVTAHNGCVRWAIDTEGVAAHSSDPSRGRSAIAMMVKVIEAIESRYLPTLTASHPLTGPAVASINIIRGGTQINVIPAACTIEIDRRIVPGEDGRGVLPAIERVLDELRRQDPNLVVNQGAPFIDPALDPAGGEWFAGQVGKALRALGLPGEPVGARYGTDASNLNAVGIPAIVIGPGDIAQAHGADEWLAIEQLDKAVEVYEAIMRSAPTGGKTTTAG